MSILVNKESRIIVQGITGTEGSFHAGQCLEYAGNVVGGVTPGKGGQTALDIAMSLYEKGILLGSSIYTTYAYSDEIIDKFIAESDTAFVQIKEAINSGNIRSYLKDDILDKNFKRLTEPE